MRGYRIRSLVGASRLNHAGVEGSRHYAPQPGMAGVVHVDHGTKELEHLLRHVDHGRSALLGLIDLRMPAGLGYMSVAGRGVVTLSFVGHHEGQFRWDLGVFEVAHRALPAQHPERALAFLPRAGPELNVRQVDLIECEYVARFHGLTIARFRMLPPRVPPSAAAVRAAWSSPRIRAARSARYSSPCPSVGAPAPGARCARRDHREPVAFRAQSWTLSIARCPMPAIRKDSSSVTALPARAPSRIMTLHTAVLMSHNARRTGDLLAFFNASCGTPIDGPSGRFIGASCT